MILIVYGSFVCLFLILYVKGQQIFKRINKGTNKEVKNKSKQESFNTHNSNTENSNTENSNTENVNRKSFSTESFHIESSDQNISNIDKNKKHIKYIQDMNEVDKKEHSFYQLYPMAYILLRWMEQRKRVSELFYQYIWTKHMDKIHESILIGVNKERFEYLEKCKMVASSFLILFLVNSLCILLVIMEMNSTQLHNGYQLIRPSKTESSSTMLLDAYIEEDGEYHKNQYEVIVEEKMHTSEEAMEVFTKFSEELEVHIKGENISMSMVTKDLTFIRKLPHTKVPITWKSSHPSIINKNGKVYNEELTESQLVEVTVVLDYLDSYMEHIFYLDIYPKEIESLSLLEALEVSIDESMEQTKTEDIVQLPSSIQNNKVYWDEVKESKHYMVFVLGIVGVIVVIIAYKKQLDQQYEKRNQQMIYDYSEVISKLSLFLRAGVSLQGAWERIVEDYKSSKVEKRFIYEEMIISMNEMNLGKDELTVLEDFGKRVSVPCYLRFVSFITQNLKKGNASLLTYLEYEGKEAFMERKELVKRLGEEAGTKLLIPMMLDLVLVLLIIMIPAFLSFGI